MKRFRRISRNDRRYKVEELTAYLAGKCCILAVAFHREFGEQIVFLMDDGKFVHACTRTIDGKLRDARGIVFPEHTSAGSYFYLPEGYGIREVTESELFAFVNAEAAGFTESQVEVAIRRAQTAWPDWDWRDSVLKRSQGFLMDLEAVSKTHLTYIRGFSPEVPPVISPLDADDILHYSVDRSEMEHFRSEVGEQQALAYLQSVKLISKKHRVYLHGTIPAQPPVLLPLSSTYHLAYCMRESVVGLRFFLETK